MISFLQDAKTDKSIHTARARLLAGGAVGAEEGDGEQWSDRYGGDEHVLKLDRDGGPTTL